MCCRIRYREGIDKNRQLTVSILTCTHNQKKTKAKIENAKGFRLLNVLFNEKMMNFYGGIVSAGGSSSTTVHHILSFSVPSGDAGGYLSNHSCSLKSFSRSFQYF